MCYLGLDYELKQPDMLRIPFCSSDTKVHMFNCKRRTNSGVGTGFAVVEEQLAGPSSSYPCLLTGFGVEALRSFDLLRITSSSSSAQ